MIRETLRSKFALSAAAAIGIGAATLTADISWNSIDGGGGRSDSAGFALHGVAGQHDAGFAAGGGFVLSGGYLVGAGSGPAPCLGDIDADGSVGLNDLLILLTNFGICQDDADFNAAADIDGSGCVDLNDLLIIMSVFGTDC